MVRTRVSLRRTGLKEDLALGVSNHFLGVSGALPWRSGFQRQDFSLASWVVRRSLLSR